MARAKTLKEVESKYSKKIGKLLDKIKNNSDPVEETPVSIDLSINCFIPETYITDRKTRIDVYKAIASIASEEEAIDMKNEIEDRFGKLPTAVDNLMTRSLKEE